MFHKKQKERVEIILGNKRKIIKKYEVLAGNVIEIEKGGKGRGNIPYRPSFNPATSFLYYSGKFGGLKRKLMLVDGAKKCLEFTPQNVEVPTVDKKTVKEYFEAHVVKSAGATTQKLEVPILLYIFVGLAVVMGVLNFMALRGMIR